ACKFTENIADGHLNSKRFEIKNLLKDLRKINPDIERNIFKAAHAVNLDTFPAYKTCGVTKSFLDEF
ncbi:MAG: hypothetical protein IJP56_00595, partial [Synergistaceae bacterium]|nr:hypothetical protein [Synergistaceae bacterium]